MNHGAQLAITALVVLTGTCLAASGCQPDVPPPTITVKPAAPPRQDDAVPAPEQNGDAEQAAANKAADPADSAGLTQDPNPP
ncbi:MAG TPA: hypothetical protein EYP14_03790 [Planctomycetaceae bacterium]|nr:hypothetical protein [Planctomycetaceae bacterium]